MPLLAIPSLATPGMETRLLTLNLIVGTNGSRLVVRVDPEEDPVDPVEPKRASRLGSIAIR